MLRDLSSLADDTFDAVVVGGGVYGLAITWDLALRGLRTALVERGDFGGATSFNSLKTVHGGIRALQHGALAEMREFVRERRAIATIAPHLVRPLPFVVPTYRHPVRNRLTMGAFFAAYDRLAWDRNNGVDPSRALPPSRTVGRAECLRLNPAIDPAGVTGGAIWHDYQLHSPERFALALLHSATRAGAAVANYAEAEAIVSSGREVRGVRVRDRESGGLLDIRARVVVNAAGPWAWPLLERAGGRPASIPPPRFSVAMNLVVRHPPLPHAVGGMIAGRFIFMVPWRDRSIVGTSHDEADHRNPDGRPPADPRLIERFLRDAAAALPRAGLAPGSITLVHRGLLPAGHSHGSLLKRSIVHDHASDGLDGLVTVVGVRYTTARATAQAAGDRVVGLLGRGGTPSRSGITPLDGGDIRDTARYTQEAVRSTTLPVALVERLVTTYGTRYADVLRTMTADGAAAAPLSASCEITRAEILHAVHDEAAIHLTDALLRRTAAGAGGHPGPEAVASAADVMAAELGWPTARRESEIAAVDDFYRLP